MLDHDKNGPKRYRLKDVESGNTVILVDPCLPMDSGKTLLAELAADICETSTVHDLGERVKVARTILWICDNESRGKGLRLKENLFYGADTAFSHLFPEDSTLFLAACRAASAEGDDDVCMAGKIQFASGCTVIAPASVLRTDAGFFMVRRMALWLRNAPKGTTVMQFWGELKDSSDAVNTALENGLRKFFCIYGDADQAVK